MDWQQKAAAMNALDEPLALHIRKPGDWYARLPAAEIGDGHVLSSLSASGATPEEAIEALWRRVTDLKPDEVIVLHAYRGNRRHVRWNGFMWTELPLPAPAA